MHYWWENLKGGKAYPPTERVPKTAGTDGQLLFVVVLVSVFYDGKMFFISGAFPSLNSACPNLAHCVSFYSFRGNLMEIFTSTGWAGHFLLLLCFPSLSWTIIAKNVFNSHCFTWNRFYPDERVQSWCRLNFTRFFGMGEGGGY